MSAPSPVGRRVFVAASVVAGALAVPLHPVATPVSAAIAGLVGLLGLRIWVWSRLPSVSAPAATPVARRLVHACGWIGLGLAVGLLLLGVIRFAIEPSLPVIGARIAAAGTLPVWRRLAIIYVAAVGEELLFRVVLLSAIVALATRLRRPASLAPTPADLWIGIALSALAFAAAHLPGWIGVTPVGVGLATAVLLLNGVAGIVLGYVFATRGILAAILTHAGADTALQLIGPLTATRG